MRFAEALVSLVWVAAIATHARADNTQPASKADSALQTPASKAQSAAKPPESEAARAVFDVLDAQLQVLDKTAGMLTAKYETRSQEMRRRARATYKLLRAGQAPLWVDKDSRSRFIERRAAARRVLSRDQAELALLREEMASVEQARQRIHGDRRNVAALHPPEPGSLQTPVAFGRVVESFGGYRHDSSRARLSRRGLTLSSRPGRNVRAVAGGEVRYTGHVRGLGDAVIVDHGDFLSIVGELAKLRVDRGDRIERGEILGESLRDRVYLEVRLEAGAGGFPVDPEPLIQSRP